MKINLLYLLVPLAIGACYLIVQNLQNQSEFTFFGTAETDPFVINLEEDVMIREVRVSTGMQVKKGDTLALAYRTDLERDLLAQDAQTAQQLVMHSTQLELLAGEKQTLMAKTAARVHELEAEIREINARDSVDQSFKAAIYRDLKVDRKLSESRIAALNDQITQVKATQAKELKELEIQAGVSTKITRTKEQETQQKKAFLNTQKERLALIAPMSGYIDQLNMTKGSLVPAFKDMLRIYPLQANKVIGFVHETADIPFHIGDSVSMVSGARPSGQIYNGSIIASSPKLVELPMRLRKFVEVRAWGREVMIAIPTENDFYIGEKISISLKHQSK